MEQKKTTRTCKVGGRTSNKPCQKRYVSEMRLVKNRLKRTRRHERRLAWLAARRTAGKRNAYLDGRKGRDHHGRRPATAAA